MAMRVAEVEVVKGRQGVRVGGGEEARLTRSTWAAEAAAQAAQLAQVRTLAGRDQKRQDRKGGRLGSKETCRGELLENNLCPLAPLLAGALLARPDDVAGLLAQLVDVLALLGPLEHEVPAEQMGVLERGHDRLGLAPGVEVEEGETARAGVELFG
jgi:hypothetical protein